MKSIKFAAPAALALGLLSAPLYADGMFGDNGSDRAAAFDRADGSRLDADGRSSFQSMRDDADAGERLRERFGDEHEFDADEMDFEDVDVTASDPDPAVGERDGNFTSGDRSLDGLRDLDTQISASRDEDGASLSVSSTGEVNGETFVASGELANTRNSEVGEDSAERTVARDAGGSLSYGEQSLSYDGSAERDASLERGDDGLTAARSRSVDRELTVGDQTYGDARENTVTRSLDSERLADGGDDQSALGDADSEDLSLDGDSTSELDPTS